MGISRITILMIFRSLEEPKMVLLWHGTYGGCLVWLGPYSRVTTVLYGLSWPWSLGPPRPGYPWSLATLAREAKLLLDRLAVKRVHWAGESLGGHVGIQFANDYPDRIASLTLCSTPYRYTSDVRAKARTWPEQLRHMSVKEWYLHDTTLRLIGERRQQMINGLLILSVVLSRRHAGIVRFLRCGCLKAVSACQCQHSSCIRPITYRSC
jgi:pimeloyl-ACP methyl ester carboxylesterase